MKPMVIPDVSKHPFINHRTWFSIMERRNVLIVGGMSDMASPLIEKLSSENFHIISISRGDNDNPNVSAVQGDALDEKSYEKALELLKGKSLDGVYIS